MLDENSVCQAMLPEDIRWSGTRINYNKEEIFLFLRDGAVQAVLPGRAVSPGQNVMGMIQIRRGAAVQGNAGAGGVACAQKRVLGGWCIYRCRLLSARRFVKRQGAALLQGQSAQDALIACVRQALTEVFAQADHAGSCRQIWQQGKRLTAERLLDCGWQLESFTPQRLVEGKRE